jgi:hypothetical protein
MRGLGGLLVVLFALALVGVPLGFGPLSRPTAAAQVSDPGEMLARSLQAVLDATSLQVDGEVDGVLSPGLVPGRPGPIQLDGLTVTVLLAPPDAATWATVRIPTLGTALETTTSWDTLWYRQHADEPWVKASVGGVATEVGVDANPLTLVDRLRAYLARPDVAPTYDDVLCPGGDRSCRRIVLETGDDPAAMLAALLPDDAVGTMPTVATRAVVLAERSSLRPVQVTLEMRSADRSLDLVVVLRTSRWDDASIVIEVPDSGR